MPALVYPDADTIAGWNLRSRGVRDGTYPSQTFEFDSTTLRGKCFCIWADRYAVIDWLLGKSALYTSGSDVKVSRLLPRCPDPDRPRIGITKVTNVTGHVFEEDDDRTTEGLPLPTYTDAEVEFLAEFLPFPLKEDADTETEFDRFVSYPDDTDTAGEFLQLPVASGHCYIGIPGSPNKAVPGNQFAKVVVQETFFVTHHQLPEAAWQPGSDRYNRIYGISEWDEADVPWMGCINKTELCGRPIGTVLYQRPHPRRRTNPSGTGFTWDIRHEFCFRSAGWNWLYNFDPDLAKRGYFFIGPSGGTEHGADTVPDDYSLYNARDLANGLFNPTLV